MEDSVVELSNTWYGKRMNPALHTAKPQLISDKSRHANHTYGGSSGGKSDLSR